jgi:hypothetical protein
MGGFRAVEDRPTPKEVYNWRLYTEAAVIATGSLLQVHRRKLQVRITNIMIGLVTIPPLLALRLLVRASSVILTFSLATRLISHQTSLRHSRLVPFSVLLYAI